MQRLISLVLPCLECGICFFVVSEIGIERFEFNPIKWEVNAK